MNSTLMIAVRRRLILPLTAALLVGCASGPLQPHPAVTIDKQDLQTLLYPQLNVETTAELGQTLISRKFIQSIQSNELKSEIAHTTSHNGIPIAIKIQPGKLTRWGENERGVYYISPNFSAEILGGQVVLKGTGGIVVPAGNKPVTTVFRKPDSVTHAFLSEHTESISYIPAENTIIPHKESFVRELIYTGVSKNVITIVYREFSNDLARPAFTQELRYDLAESDIIGYKGARFQVLKATNVGLQYKVLRAMD